MCHRRTFLVKLFLIASTASAGESTLMDFSFLDGCRGLLAQAAVGGTIAQRVMAGIADGLFPTRTNRQFVVLSSLQRTYPGLSELSSFLANFTLERDANDHSQELEFSGRWQPTEFDQFFFSLTPSKSKNSRAHLTFYYYFSNLGATTMSIKEYINLVERWIQADEKIQKPGSRGDVDYTEHTYTGIKGSTSEIKLRNIRSMIYGKSSVAVEIEDLDVKEVFLSLKSLVGFIVQQSPLPASSAMKASLAEPTHRSAN